MRDRFPFHAAVVLAAAFLLVTTDVRAQQVEVEHAGDGTAIFRVSQPELATETAQRLAEGDPETGQQFLEVRVGDPAHPHAAPPDSTPPLAGDYSFANDMIEFRSRFPLQAGLTYWTKAAGGWHRHEVPPVDSTPTTSVVQVYPTADLLPENQLKFYLHFSAPMQQGGAYRHISLYDDTGGLVELPFLELDEELWDRSGTRFTLFIDPGRIKLGVKPREDVGTALMESGRFALVVAPSWLDAAGRPLHREFRKVFQVGPADHASPDPAQWVLQAPNAGTRDPLVVEFGESLDHALLQRLVWIHRANDAGAVTGEATIGPDEASWSFTPAQPWSEGSYEVRAAALLEDLAGNNIARPFDRDLTAGESSRGAETTTRVSFEVRR